MAYPKIATCCYCGTRAALVLRGGVRHELACASCGAPLHDLKSLPRDLVQRASRSPEPRPVAQAPKPNRAKAPKRRKRRSLSRRIMSEVVDLIDDILD